MWQEEFNRTERYSVGLEGCFSKEVTFNVKLEWPFGASVRGEGSKQR